MLTLFKYNTGYVSLYRVKYILYTCTLFITKSRGILVNRTSGKIAHLFYTDILLQKRERFSIKVKKDLSITIGLELFY